MKAIQILINKINSLNSNIIVGESEKASFLQEKRGAFTSSPDSLVLMPGSVTEASKIIEYCNDLKIGFVPQSGNTGLVGGSVSGNSEVIISSKKLNKIRSLDKKNATVELEAGVILETAIDFARKHNLEFPLNLPSKNECLIGGNLATNAGGISTLKYGPLKNNTLGIEVILPNGNIYSDLNALTKRNIGPDLKSLFIGSEGILGFITAAVIKLAPLPNKQIHALFALDTLEQVIEIYQDLKSNFVYNLSAFEVINLESILISLKHFPNANFPLKKGYKLYGLITIDIYNNEINEQLIENLFIKYSKKVIKEYYISSNDNIWDFRNSMSDSQKLEGLSIKHDIALPLSSVASFIKKAEGIIYKYSPKNRIVMFGHLGDNSLHFNISEAENKGESEKFKSFRDDLKSEVIDLVVKNNGSFSSEHGVGKVYTNAFYKYHRNQFNLLKQIKLAIDPNNICNPNKIISFTEKNIDDE